jgi:hypothetical protein
MGIMKEKNIDGNKKYIRFTKKIIKELLNQYQSQEQNLPYFSDVTSFLNEYSKTGKHTFEYKCITFGAETVMTLEVVNILEWLSIYHSSKSAYLFFQNQNNDSFNLMIKSYSLHPILYLTAQKYETFVISDFEADIALAALFSSFLFPKAFLGVTKHLLKFLEDKKEKEMNRIRPTLGNYGRNNVLILLTEVLKHYNQPELAKEVDSYCTEEKEPLFRLGIQMALSKNADTFNHYIDKLYSFHIDNSKSSDHTYPFHNLIWQFFPVEILILFYIRKSTGIHLEMQDNPMINMFLPFISYPFNTQLDVFTKSLFDKSIVDSR